MSLDGSPVRKTGPQPLFNIGYNLLYRHRPPSPWGLWYGRRRGGGGAASATGEIDMEDVHALSDKLGATFNEGTLSITLWDTRHDPPERRGHLSRDEMGELITWYEKQALEAALTELKQVWHEQGEAG